VQVLGSAIDLPAAEDIERLAVHDKDAGRTLGAVLATAAEGTHIDAFRTTMHRVGPRVTGLFEYLLRFDDLVDLRLLWVGLGIDNINARGPESGDNEIAALEEGVASER
jgi:hypothetical protein